MRVTIECVQGDITEQKDIEVIVNAANSRLEPGGGVAGAIHRKAGRELVQECRTLAPIKPGQAVITKGYNLPNSYVIHCLGPVYGKDKPEDILLADCYRNALLLADEYKIQSIAFPAISTGIFGYPIKEAAQVAINTAKDTVPQLKHLKIIRFVLFSKNDYDVFNSELK